MTVENKPDYGDEIVEDGKFTFPMLEFLDALVDQFNTLQEQFASFRLNSLNFFTTAGYGAIGTSGTEALSDISTAFQTLPATVAIIAEPRLTQQDIDTDSLRYLVKGVWAISVAATFSFVDLNAGRTFDIRLFNVTQGTVTETVPVFVGRNQAGVNFGSTFLVQLGDAAIGDRFRVEVGNTVGADFTTAVLESYKFSTWHVSELQAFPLDETLTELTGG